MKATKDMVVALSYELNVDGQIADKAGSDRPLEYIHGTGMLLPKFEAEVEGKEPGETFDFILSAADGYGEYNPQFKVTIPKSAFEIDGKVREDLLVTGRVIPMLNSEGQVIQGTVASVSEESVEMDFNHPLAGKSLHFTGKVETVREATAKELAEGLHGEYLPKEGCHCGKDGCDCGNEEGGCCHEHKGEGCCHGKCSE